MVSFNKNINLVVSQKIHNIAFHNLKQNNMTHIAQIIKPTDSFTEQLRFLHKQSLACLRMIEIAEDQIERNRWISEYTDNQIELMNLQQVNHAL
jgi:hypothetical protein